jgi:hypothetical protein
MLFDMKTIDKVFLSVKDVLKNDNTELKYLKGKSDEILKQKLRLQTIQDKLPSKERLDRLEYKYTNISKILDGIKKKEELENKIAKLIRIKKLLNTDKYRAELRKIKIYMMVEKIEKLVELKKTTITCLLALKLEMIQYYNNQVGTNQVEIKKLEAEKSQYKICPLCERELSVGVNK